MKLTLARVSASAPISLLFFAATILGALLITTATQAQGPGAPRASAAGIDWQLIEPANSPAFEIARTETTIGQFKRYIQANPLVSLAEQRGGGEVFEGGWTRMPGWTWRTPMGPSSQVSDNEPAVHVTYSEAQGFCRWAGAALPTDQQWVQAAYTETRAQPPAGWTRTTTYPYPTGNSPEGAQCLGDCGAEVSKRAIRHNARLTRGEGHALAGTTKPGVNGLFDMGANAWEWVDEPPGNTTGEKRTRGGSWWYGAAQMRADYLQGKPQSTAVVYIGFRCARPVQAR